MSSGCGHHKACRKTVGTITTTEVISQSYKRTILELNEIVLALRGEIGKSLLVSSKLAGCNLTRGLARISPNSKVLPAFLFQMLNSPHMSRKLELRSNGSALQEISIGVLRQVSVCLPPLPEQQKIAAILSTWDRAIELTEKLIAAKQKRKQALMQQLLTGKVRLPQFVGSKKWTTTMLGDVVSLSSGGTPSKANPDYWNGEVPWVTAKDLKRRRLTDSIDHVSEIAIGNGTRLMPTGTVFVLVRGMTLLKDVPVCIASVPMCFNQDIRALTIHEKYDYRFIAYSLVASKHRLLSLVNVAGHGTGRLATEFLVEFPIRVPPTEDEQVSISDVIEVADAESSLLVRRVEKLRSQKKGLMQQLLTGKVRVNVDPKKAKEIVK